MGNLKQPETCVKGKLNMTMDVSAIPITMYIPNDRSDKMLLTTSWARVNVLPTGRRDKMIFHVLGSDK